METFTKWMYEILIDNGISSSTALTLNLIFNLVVITIGLFILDYFFKRLIIKLFQLFTNKTKTTYDDFLVASNFPKYIAHIVPFIVLRALIPLVLSDFSFWENTLIKITDIYLIILIVWIFRSILRTTINFLRNMDRFKDKPLESYSQVFLIFLWFLAGIFIFSELTGMGIWTFLTTLGAASAVFLLIFRDTILGFVASIQVSVNDMVRIGDWISIDKYGADGEVIEINLATVKVSNWDKTFTTVPTYALISDSFKNWRGMQESGGRRIKRSLKVKMNSVKFLSQQELEHYSKIQLISDYITHRQKDIDAHNQKYAVDKSKAINGRNQTNLGLFRKYCDVYLNQHPAVNKDMMIMARHLSPDNEGIPIEIYTFSRDKEWVNYEHIIADIFEHLIAAVASFDLEIYQAPGSNDLKNFNKHMTALAK